MIAPEPFTAAFPAVADSVPRARHGVVEYLRAAATPDPPLSDVALAVSEAMSNSVIHAYVGADPGEVRIRVQVAGDELQLTVEDDGGGLLPRPDSPGLGLGLVLIAKVAERFDARTAPGEGTRLCMWFRRDAADATMPE